MFISYTNLSIDICSYIYGTLVVNLLNNKLKVSNLFRIKEDMLNGFSNYFSFV